MARGSVIARCYYLWDRRRECPTLERMRRVRANIERMHAENPEAPVVIHPHPGSKTDTTVRILDSARRAGVGNVSLAAS